MQTIMLSAKMPAGYGGRPKRLGDMEITDHGWGIFLGYDNQCRKVVINHYDLEKALKEGIGGNYEIRVELSERRHDFSIMKFCARTLIPKRIKGLITEEALAIQNN